MNAHSCTSYNPACYRCDLGRDEALEAARDMLKEVVGIVDMGEIFAEAGMLEAVRMCTERAQELSDDAEALFRQTQVKTKS